MNRFEGLPSESNPDMSSYEPGSGIPSSELAEAVVAPYADKTLYNIAFINRSTYLIGAEERNKKLGDKLPNLIEPYLDEKFNAHLFLDDVVHALANRTHDHFQYLLLDPLVQLLYKMGHNNFSVNLALFPIMPVNLASCLRGTPKRPLHVRYTGSVSRQIGPYSRYCEITLEGDVIDTQFNTASIGFGAVMSRFTLHGETDHAGGRSRGCVYHFLKEDYLPIQRKPRSSGCRYYSGKLALPAEEQERDWTLWSEVASIVPWNKCYKASEGSWKEVKP